MKFGPGDYVQHVNPFWRDTLFQIVERFDNGDYFECKLLNDWSDGKHRSRQPVVGFLHMFAAVSLGYAPEMLVLAVAAS